MSNKRGNPNPSPETRYAEQFSSETIRQCMDDLSPKIISAVQAVWGKYSVAAIVLEREDTTAVYGIHIDREDLYRLLVRAATRERRRIKRDGIDEQFAEEQ